MKFADFLGLLIVGAIILSIAYFSKTDKGRKKLASVMLALGCISMVGSILKCFDSNSDFPISNFIVSVVFLGISVVLYPNIYKAEDKNKPIIDENNEVNIDKSLNVEIYILDKFPILINGLMGSKGKTKIQSHTSDQIIISAIEVGVTYIICEKKHSIDVFWKVDDEVLGDHLLTWSFIKDQGENKILVKILSDISKYSNKNFNTQFEEF